MKIGIDGRFWNQTGVGRYIREIVGEISRLDQKNEYVVFLMEEDYDKVDLPANFKKIRTDIRWHTLAEQVRLPLLYMKEHLDILFVPNFNIPVLYPRPIVVTIHDLTLLRTRTGQVTKLPYALFLIKYLASAVVHLVAVRKAEKIFTVSEFVKNDLIRTFRIDPKKVVLTPNAVDKSFYRRSEEQVNEVLKKYRIAVPYIFYVGNGCPHKNLGRLVKAFEKLAEEIPQLTLVLGGKMDFNYRRLADNCKELKVKDRIIFTGFIDDKDLPSIYSGAASYVSPSMYEGFGIQVLEAYACGCKVACSKATSLPEVGGDLAYYFDPYNEEDMVRAICESVNGKSGDFADKALARAGNFSWKSSAEKVLQVLTSV